VWSFMGGLLTPQHTRSSSNLYNCWRTVACVLGRVEVRNDISLPEGNWGGRGVVQIICVGRLIERQTEEPGVGAWCTFATVHTSDACVCIWTRHWGAGGVCVADGQDRTGCRGRLDDIWLLTTASCWFTHAPGDLWYSLLVSVCHD